MKTLLEKAKSYKGNKITGSTFSFEEELELTLAWLNGEIGTTQYGKAIKETNKEVSGSVMYRVSSFLRKAMMEKKIVIKKIKL